MTIKPKYRVGTVKTIVIPKYIFTIKIMKVECFGKDDVYTAYMDFGNKKIKHIPFCEYPWRCDLDEIEHNVSTFIDKMRDLQRKLKKWR